MLLAYEPTNHLDLDAITALEELLCNYPGTLIFTTHDRRLLKAIAKNLLVFDGTKLNFFPGPYDDYSNKQISTEYTEATADILLIENKLAEIISRLSLNPTEKLGAEFQSLLAKAILVSGLPKPYRKLCNNMKMIYLLCELFIIFLLGYKLQNKIHCELYFNS